MRDIYCAVTDPEWYDFLAGRTGLSEVNFWKPSPRAFKAVGEGSIFAFKLKSPYNKIGGFGVLTTSADAEIGLAWESFGTGNGVASLGDFVQKIRTIRKSSDIDEYSLIGVRVLVHHVFFSKNQWFDPPADWSSNTVSGKTYSTGTQLGQDLIEKLEKGAGGFPEAIAPRKNFFGLSEQPQATYGSPIPVKPRLGQGVFRLNVMKVYKKACALTATCVTPALEAAHIRPFGKGGDHSVQNGILLRRDIHSLFDAGLATFDNERRFRLSQIVAKNFGQATEYSGLCGKQLRMPSGPKWAASLEHLSWHRNNVFRG